jgi:hypothetical protein
MLRSHPNIAQIDIIAATLNDLCDRVTFVGGATVPLYVEDAAAWFPTPSADIDCVVEIAARGPYSRFEEELRKRGFRDPTPEEIEEGAPVCRKYVSELAVDVMPTDARVLGFGNRWFLAGVRNRASVVLPSGRTIFCFSLPHFLATKFEAYKGRGLREDPRFSQDLEDVANVLDGVGDRTLQASMESADRGLLRWLSGECERLLKDRLLLKEAVVGFVRDEVRAERILQLIEKNLVRVR